MSEILNRIKGTQDILPKDSYKWQFVESVMFDEAQSAGFKEIRTPVFEHTELFNRGVGETTDVVQKEMYTFDTKGGVSITLRPEGTAGAARALLENALYNDGLPVKLSYLTSCYRYEKPQAGRYREFHQFGLEAYGTASPLADAEMILTASSIFERLGITDISLEINSIGCPECRKKYHEALHDYFENKKDKLCDTCVLRLEKNPMRILDCKSPVCKDISKDAPVILDYLCDDCKDHFNMVKAYLDKAEIAYTINPQIDRGLDYYTKTVFEFVCDYIGAQGTICGGGRYDGLIEELGGKPLPSLGFAIGMERLLSVMEKQGIEIPKSPECQIYIVSMGDRAAKESFALAKLLRESSIKAQFDIVGRSLKAQMKYADKIGAEYSVVIGDNEIDENKAVVKNMKTGTTKEIKLSNFIDGFIEIMLNDENEKIKTLLN